MKRWMLVAICVGCNGEPFIDFVGSADGGPGSGGSLGVVDAPDAGGGAGSAVATGDGGSASATEGGNVGHVALGGAPSGGSGGFLDDAAPGGGASGGAPDSGTAGSGAGGSGSGGAPSGGAPAGGYGGSDGGCSLVTHETGLGQTWQDCAPLATYDLVEATQACEAWCNAVGCFSCFQGSACDASNSAVIGQVGTGTDEKLIGWARRSGSVWNITTTGCGVVATWR